MDFEKMFREFLKREGTFNEEDFKLNKLSHEKKLFYAGCENTLNKLRNEFINKLNTLTNLCFTREAQLSGKIKGYDYHNGYSCALHDIRGELEAIKDTLKIINHGGNE